MSPAVSDDASLGFHGRSSVGVDVSVDEVLEKELGVLEITGLVIVGLSVNFVQCFLEIFSPPHELLDVYMSDEFTWVSEEVLVLLDQLLSPEVAVLVEEVGLEDLLAV